MTKTLKEIEFTIPERQGLPLERALDVNIRGNAHRSGIVLHHLHGPFLARLEDANIQQRFRVFVERRKRLLAKAGTAAGQGEGAPLTPGALQQIDDILKKADVSTFMKRQPVTLCFGNQPPKPIFQEIFVGVNELRQAIAPNVNLRGARSLFHHLTRTLDTRVFRALLDGYVTRNSGPFSSLCRCGRPGACRSGSAGCAERAGRSPHRGLPCRL